MLTIRMQREGNWCTSLDLKDTYFPVPIFKAHRTILRFTFMDVAYKYQCLPFSYSLAPCTFSKCIEAALLLLRCLRKRVILILMIY